MKKFKRAKKLIRESKNISLSPSTENRGEFIPLALALFYTLKKLNKNVNLLVEDFPKKFQFLIPSLDSIYYPRGFVLSIPNSKAEISRVSYEKNQNSLNLYLTLDKGKIKKNDIFLNQAPPLPDLLITLGVKEQSQINFPVLNLDSFEVVFNLIKSINNNLIGKDAASCLFCSLIILSGNFQQETIKPAVFEMAAFLTKMGVSHKEIIDNLY